MREPRFFNISNSAKPKTLSQKEILQQIEDDLKFLPMDKKAKRLAIKHINDYIVDPVFVKIIREHDYIRKILFIKLLLFHINNHYIIRNAVKQFHDFQEFLDDNQHLINHDATKNVSSSRPC